MGELQTQYDEGLVRQEESVVRQYALRWAVLAAWRDALTQRGAPLPSGLEPVLTGARIKIASGCFSACEIGCELLPAEAALTSADASSRASTVDFWLDLLGHSMADDAESLLKMPAIQFRLADCGVPGCRCGPAA